jgi:hypothetical protein
MKELKHGEVYDIRHPVTGRWTKAEYREKRGDEAFDVFVMREGEVIAKYVRSWQ